MSNYDFSQAVKAAAAEQEEKERLQLRVAHLQLDENRLDWIARNCSHFSVGLGTKSGHIVFNVLALVKGKNYGATQTSIRAAIDKVMKDSTH